jgi:hypothetical protein
MSRILSEIITNPFCEGTDFHLAVADRGPGAESFVFIPRSEAPGLTIDIIRLDFLPRQFPRLQDLFEIVKTRLIAYAGPERAHCELVSGSPTEIVFRSGFTGHPLAGGQDTVGRLTDLGRSIRSLQAIRKIDPLTSDELDARLTYVTDLETVDIAALRRHPQSATEFIRNCLDGSRRLVAATTAKRGDERKDPASLEDLVIHASPLHETVHWAVLAKFVAADLLERGKLESFDIARRMLGLAVLNLDDARRGGRGELFLRQQIRDALDPLAELLLYDGKGDRAAHVRRAADIWRLCASWDIEGAPDRAGQSEAMAAFAESIAQMSRNPPWDAGLGRAAAALHRKEAVEGMVAKIYGVCSRMAYVARRLGGDRMLLLAACLGADLTQLLIERATVLGALDFDTYTKESIQSAQWQIDAQLALFGMTREDLGRTNQRQLPSTRPLLFYLRPLGTARRELMPNRFPDRFKTTYGRQILPDTISIEAALQVALVSSFKTEALGGPIDIFGMGRGTVLGGGADGWKAMAKINIEHAALIAVLPGDSEGLSWELAEILRQGAASRTIFILSPEEAIGAPPMSPSAHERLRAIGFALPMELEPGFVLLAANGSFDRRIPFDWLWDGRLEAELRSRVQAALGG